MANRDRRRPARCRMLKDGYTRALKGKFPRSMARSYYDQAVESKCKWPEKKKRP